MKSAAATRNSVVPGKSKKLGSGTRKRFSHKQQFDQTTSLSTSLSTASLFTSYTYPSSSSPSQSIGNSGIKARGPRPRGPPRKPSSTSSSSSSSPSLSAQGKQRSSFPRNAGQANDLGANHVDKDSSNKAWASFEFPFSSLQLHQEEETTTSYTHRIGALRGSGYQPHNANASAGMLSAGGSADGVGAGGSRKKKQRPTTAGPRRSLPSKSRDDRSPVSFSSSPSSLSRPASSSFSCGRRKDKGALGTSVSTGNITLGSKVRTRPSSSYASFSSSPGSPHMASSHSAATLVRERPVSSYAKLSAVADRHSYDSRDGDIGDGNNSVGNESVLVETHCSDETRHALGHTQAQKIDTDVNYRDLLKEKRGFGSDNHFDDRGNLANVNNDESDEHLNVSSAAVKSNVQKPDPRQRKKIRPMSASAVRVNTRHEDTGREHVNNFLHQDSSNNAKRTTGTAVRARKKVIRPSSSYASSSPSTSLSSASPSISTSTSLNFCYFKDIDGSNDVGSGDASSTYRSTARSLHSVHESSNLEQILSSSPSSSSFGTSQGGSKVNAKTNPVLGSKKTKASEGGNRKGKERGKKRGKKKDLTLADIAKAKQSVSSSLSLPSTSSGAGPRFRSVVVELEIKLAEKLQMIRVRHRHIDIILQANMCNIHARTQLSEMEVFGDG